MATLESLEQEIVQQSALYNQLKIQNGSLESIEEARVKLGELKKSKGALIQAAGSGSKDKKKDRLLLKTAKGTRDYGPGEMFCREHIENIVKECFALYGASCLDTPVFERKDILTGKYGEDAKLIFDLMDQGGEQLALRYDHTVPLARYFAMAGTTITQAKLWQVGKVYRRDSPVISKGRMREFSQADIDFAGMYDPMIPDAEIISLLSTILTKLEIGEYTIKLNHRKILDGIFEVCGVPSEKVRTISSAVDKLDKLPWADVKKEMTEEKGLDPSVADKIGEYVKLQGAGLEKTQKLLDKLLEDPCLTSNSSAKQGLSDMSILFDLLRSYKVLDKVSFDMSLARGLDYYTGIIYEAIVEASAPPGFRPPNALASSSTTTFTSTAPIPTPAQIPADSKKKPSKNKSTDEEEEEEVDESQVGVGSIAAGGRYDSLVGMFLSAAAGEGKKSNSIPCVGVSMGLDRIFAILWPKWVARGMRSKGTMVYVMAAGDGLLKERVELVQTLREAGIKTEYMFKNKPKLPAQFAAGEKDEVPFAIILGGEELKQGLVIVKEQNWEFKDGQKVKIAKDKDDKGTPVKQEELINWLKSTRTYQDWEIGKFIF